MRTFAIVFFLGVTVAPASAQDTTEQIRSLRTQSNAAIARHDVDGVVSQFDADYQMTTGSGALYQDRSAEAQAWTDEFARANDLVYIRTPESIEVSDTGTRAAEIGGWSGSWTTAEGVQRVGGRYAAHWVLTSGGWKLRSELFVTLRCEGARCS